MIFNSLAFAVFAPLFFVFYFSTQGRTRLALLVVASYFFYAWWDWRFVSLLLLSSVIDYRIGLAMAGTDEPSKRRELLTISLCSNLGILGFFKYFNFFTESFAGAMAALGWTVSPTTLNVILPVGISFYTFQTLSYSIDLYRRRIDVETDFLRFAAYVSLFPQLVAGPIVRAADLLPQLRVNQIIDYSRIGRGLEMIIWGFFLKLCLADTAATVVDARFSVPEFPGALSHIIGIFCFSFQIYGDFAGYSLIAIGLGRIMGFDFGVNFNRPYFARSFSEFWSRWHISLSSWLRDYLYISLGGNRHGAFRTFRNLILTMALGGLWHGAGWNYVIWGLLHGAYLVLQRILFAPFWKIIRVLRIPCVLANAFLIILIFSLTSFAWIFFRAESLDDALTILHIIGEFDNLKIHAGEQRIGILKTFILIGFVVLIDALSMMPAIRNAYMNSTIMRTGGALIITWSIIWLGSFQGASFIYFQF